MQDFPIWARHGCASRKPPVPSGRGREGIRSPQSLQYSAPSERGVDSSRPGREVQDDRLGSRRGREAWEVRKCPSAGRLVHASSFAFLRSRGEEVKGPISRQVNLVHGESRRGRLLRLPSPGPAPPVAKGARSPAPNRRRRLRSSWLRLRSAPRAGAVSPSSPAPPKEEPHPVPEVVSRPQRTPVRAHPQRGAPGSRSPNPIVDGSARLRRLGLVASALPR